MTQPLEPEAKPASTPVKPVQTPPRKPTLGRVRDYFAVQLDQDDSWRNYRPNA